MGLLTNREHEKLIKVVAPGDVISFVTFVSYER